MSFSDAVWDSDRPDRGRPHEISGDDVEVIILDDHRAKKTDAANDAGGAVTIEMPDGSVVVDFSGRDSSDPDDRSKFGDNLAKTMQMTDLGSLAEDLLQGIEADKQSREEWLTTRERAMKLLGLNIEEPRAAPGGSDGAPLEGMSTTKDPVLTEAVVRGQANAIGEFLPAAGPAKIENDGDGNLDDIAEALQEGFNHYLTSIATEFYPDTKRMLAWLYFGGSGVKKVYHCPLRDRPVSESIQMQNFLVSNAATDIENADRVTHIITMRQSVYRRMVMLGMYVDIAATQPTAEDKNRVQLQSERIEGVRSDTMRPEDQPYTLYEVCCERVINLDNKVPRRLKNARVPVPYRVTIEKDSRRIIDVRRNWREGDEECRLRRMYVKYSFIEWIGFYGIGLLHLMGNLTIALTGMLRIGIDNGMLANFPGALGAKSPTAKQEMNQLPVGPGQIRLIDMAGLDDIRKVVMALPYKDVTQGIFELTKMVRDYAQRLGGTADMPIGEGKQDAPVGTTIALIEQSTKMESAVHKGLHQSQAIEFELLIELFREDPEAFWRHRKYKRGQQAPWNAAKLLQALDDYDLVPKSDPNTPSHLHRVMKAVARLQLAQAAPPGTFNMRAVYRQCLYVLGDTNPEQYMAPEMPPGPPAPSPELITAQAKAKDADTKQVKALSDAQNAEKKLDNDAANREAELRMGNVKLATELVIHGNDQANANRSHGLELRKHALDATTAAHTAAMDVHEATKPPEQTAT